MKISEIAYVVQGEGLNLGTPSILIRLSNCNLRCDFCDSKYTWKEEKEMSIDEVIAEVNKYNCRHIMISGGEPLLQQEDLIKLMEQLLRQNPFWWYFEIESNGTIAPKKRLAELTDLFTVSPKFEDFTYCPAYSNIEDLAERPQVVFKFVIDKLEDFKDIEQFVKTYALYDQTIYLMPCAITVEEHNKRLPMLIEYAKKHYRLNIKITPRLQILAFGNKRGT